MRNSLLTAALALLAVFNPIAAQQRPAPPHQRAAPPAPSTAGRLTDAQIDAAIRFKLAKSKIGADKFRFKVQGGVVTIEGNTDVMQHKGAATRMARTAGAIGVNNHIQLSAAAKERAEANLAKGRRRAQIKRGDPRNSGSASRQVPGVTAPKTAAALVQKR